MADSALAALNSLLKGSSIEDHEEALKLANAATKASKGGADLLTAQHAKVVALLKLDRFDDALRAIAEAGSRLESQCPLEKAYALYKTGDLDGAEAALESAGEETRALRHVAAQMAYRAERFDEAAAHYRELARDPDGSYGEETDLKINSLAAAAQLEWQGRGEAAPEGTRQPGREDLEAFETAYNAACGCLARAEFAKATVLLKRARDLCEASEDLSDEEKKAELLPIMVQQAYACTRLGKLGDAAELMKAVTVSDMPDLSTQTVAQNNSLALKAEGGNPYLIQRLAESIPEATGSDRLFRYQAAILNRNKYIIELQAQKFSGVKSKTARLLAQDAAPSASPDKVGLGMLNAAATAHLKSGKEALQLILPLLDSRPDDVGLLLTIIQLYIQTANPVPALSLLEAFFKRLETAVAPDHSDVRYAPGLVALAVALYRMQGRHSAVRNELAKAAAHWEQAAGTPPTSLLREAGIELLRSSRPSDLAAAGAAFERLVTASPGDKAATAGLVASFATSDYAKVEPHLAGLAPAEKLTAGVDVQALISRGVASLPAPPSQAASKKRALDESAGGGADKGTAAQQPARKKRRRRLPKSYEEGKQLDPERWLPLRDRSTYRPKGKKGKKRAAEATQGGMPVAREEGETLELVGGAGAVKVEKAPAGGKKKKKGKK
ncbi:Signal recognition particle subunit SRP72 [Pleurostoma richardsiae]|uniref:Signal recognition particle subunit SRP72 n=1 Tax=Pleurostoma richardsiae TaxID=41990 RepID=A0AA38VDS8_9PEZI|nr:Signal recognition particle subunit SRP72 [Pleurostoma richardsiae]